jgi:hypothetical protein
MTTIQKTAKTLKTPKFPMKTKMKDFKKGLGVNAYLSDKNRLFSVIKNLSTYGFDENLIPIHLRYDREVILKMIELGVVLNKNILSHFEDDQEVMQADQKLIDCIQKKRREYEESLDDDDQVHEGDQVHKGDQVHEGDQVHDEVKLYQVFSELPLDLQQDEEKFEVAKFELLVDLVERKVKIQDLKYSRFNEDRDIAFLSIHQDYEHFVYFSESIKEDEFLYAEFKQKLIDSEVFSDPDIVRRNVNSKGFKALFHQIKKSLDDQEIIERLMNMDYNRFYWASDRLKSDPAFVLFAVRQHWRNLSQVKLNVDEHEEIYQVAKTQLLLVLKQQSSDHFSFDDPIDQACITPRMYTDQDLAPYLKNT